MHQVPITPRTLARLGSPLHARETAHDLRVVYLRVILPILSQLIQQRKNLRAHQPLSRGESLTDEDREGWLEALGDHETAQPSSPNVPPHLVMTCSTLKRHYRDVLREGGVYTGNLRIRFVFLDAPEGVLVKRTAEMKGHFAGPNLVHSQFAVLERPDEDEGDVIVVDVTDRPLDAVEMEVQNRVKEEMMMDDGSYLRVL